MSVSYKKLFHLLIEKNMTNAESICRVLNCGVDDILEFVPEDNGGKENG